MIGAAFWSGSLVLGLLVILGFAYARPKSPVKRVGMVIGIKPDKLEEYQRLHADSCAGVRDLLSKANIANFSIFLRQLDGAKFYLFGYYEYIGDNYEEDMARLAAEPRNKEWLSVTDPMQIPLPGESTWAMMEEVYYNH